MAVDFTENKASIISLGIVAGQAIAAWFLGFVVGKRQSSDDKWILVWIFYNIWTILTMEGPFVYLSLTGTVQDSNSTLAMIWKEYGKVDSRWLHSDPNVLSVEMITVALGVLNVGLVIAICYDCYCRHFLQIILCVTEMYGGWMIFCPEWLTGWQNLHTKDPIHHFVYLWFLNSVWVLIPSLLLLHSLNDMKNKHVPSPHVTNHQHNHKKRQ